MKVAQISKIMAKGGAMANCLYNICQHKIDGGILVIDKETAETLDRCRKEWDDSVLELHRNITAAKNLRAERAKRAAVKKKADKKAVIRLMKKTKWREGK